ncbi:hypothetical protein LEP1GSC124_0385 [Leptospira interrogans serovar Pyrogenes str. 200701872]|uniref:SLEI domain protein, PF07620 family n=1 Tax=Leptospira interrogans serovar Pyrogenes str. 200701872 TaxID=1193029 RepID=M7A0R0_LEPIR|nr:hypothetical protein LEP1GSC124_0385 [Leptospira interrogans serovar Pyrogenes str. 200701872]
MGTTLIIKKNLFFYKPIFCILYAGNFLKLAQNLKEFLHDHSLEILNQIAVVLTNLDRI